MIRVLRLVGEPNCNGRSPGGLEERSADKGKRSKSQTLLALVRQRDTKRGGDRISSAVT